MSRSTLSRARSAAVIAGLATTLVAPAAALPALAHSPSNASSSSSSQEASVGERAVQEASRHKGKPYRYGAAGPNAFDCSGFTQYVFRQLGIELPHSSAAQYNSVRHIDKRDIQLGDLVFMRSRGRVSHVGIYAGDNTFWVARRSGTTITQQRIWTTDFLVGRAG